MLDRWHRGSGSQNKYDPQVGAAASANAAIAQKAEQWNEDFYDKYVAPTLTQAMRESEVNLGRQGQIFDLTMDQAKLADERYRKYGIPAEDAYYKMVQQYSAPEEQERQAQAALGDVRTTQ